MPFLLRSYWRALCAPIPARGWACQMAVISPSMTISSPNEYITVSLSDVCCRDNRHEPQRSLRPGMVIGIVRISGGDWDLIFNRAETSLPGSPR